MNIMINILAFLVVCLAAGAEGWLLFGPKPMIDDILIGRILGTLDSALFMVLSYFYGASPSHRATQRASDQPEKKETT